MPLRPQYGNERVRLALLVGAGLVLLAPGAGVAQQINLASDTLVTCQNNANFDVDAYDRMIELGWRAIEEADHDTVVARIRDAVAITARDTTDPVDWADAMAEAQSVAEGLPFVDDPSLLTLLVQDNAALAVINLSDDQSYITRCVYGGPVDAEQGMTFDTVARADDGVGITQGDPHLHSYSMQNAWIEGDKQLEMSLQAARFLPTATDLLGRAPAVEMGFSLFAIAEN